MQTKKIPETLTWKAPSHIQHNRSAGWYLGFIFAGLALLAFAFYIQSITAGITFFLIIAVLMVTGSQSSREVTIKITKTGIASDNVVYPYKIIKKFWILYNPPHVKTLNFETTAYLNNRIVLQMGNQDPITIKMMLAEYLPEDIDKEESVSETLARRLKI